MDFSFIPVPILFIITVFMAVCQNTVRAKYVKKIKPTDSTVFFFNGTLSLIALIIFLALSGFNIKISSLTLVLATLYGVAVTTQMITNTIALKVGPYSYTTVIISLSTVITALSGWMFWGETLSVFKILGLVFMIFCFFFAVDKKNDKNSANAKWFILCMICLIFGASLGLIQKTHQKSDFKAEITGFLTIAFSISTCFSFLGALFLRRKEEKSNKFENEDKVKLNVKSFLLAGVIVGIGVAINNVLNLYLAGAVDSSIMFPIVNGVPFVSAVIISFLFFKERLTKSQTLGIIIGVISMVFLCV